MIQFNLLPDVKLEYIKAERTKRLAISVSVLASIVAIVLLVLLLLVVDGVQKKNLNDLNANITTRTKQLQKSPNLNKILTVQNQLASLDGLHDQKPAAARFFNYLGQVTPSSVTVSNSAVDFTEHTISITGNAGSLDNVNTFVDTLKFTKYTTDKDSASQNAFTGVVLSSFSRSTAATGGTTSYTITTSFNPDIFDNTKDVTLSVPQTVTTRSITEQPLFKAGSN